MMNRTTSGSDNSKTNQFFQGQINQAGGDNEIKGDDTSFKMVASDGVGAPQEVTTNDAVAKPAE